MEDYEVLNPGGHKHLIDKIKECLDHKADADMLTYEEVDGRKLLTLRTTEGEE